MLRAMEYPEKFTFKSKGHNKLLSIPKSLERLFPQTFPSRFHPLELLLSVDLAHPRREPSQAGFQRTGVYSLPEEECQMIQMTFFFLNCFQQSW